MGVGVAGGGTWWRITCQHTLAQGHLNPAGMRNGTYTGHFEHRELRIPPMSTQVWKRLSDSYMHTKAELKRALKTTDIRAPLVIKRKAQRRKATYLRLHSPLMPKPDLELRSPSVQFQWTPKI